jgi:hypothetical protein
MSKTKIEAKHCLCGCGSEVAREFRPGHDARYKSQLIKAAIDGDNRAEATIHARGWGAFLEKSRNASVTRAQRAERKQTREQLRPPKGEGNIVLLETMKAARAVLIEMGRYGREAGARQIQITGQNAAAIAERVFDFDNYEGDGHLPPLDGQRPKRKAIVR